MNHRPSPWEALVNLTTDDMKTAPVLPLCWRTRLLHPFYPYLEYVVVVVVVVVVWVLCVCVVCVCVHACVRVHVCVCMYMCEYCHRGSYY